MAMVKPDDCRIFEIAASKRKPVNVEHAVTTKITYKKRLEVKKELGIPGKSVKPKRLWNF